MDIKFPAQFVRKGQEIRKGSDEITNFTLSNSQLLGNLTVSNRTTPRAQLLSTKVQLRLYASTIITIINQTTLIKIGHHRAVTFCASILLSVYRFNISSKFYSYKPHSDVPYPPRSDEGGHFSKNIESILRDCAIKGQTLPVQVKILRSNSS